MMEVVELEDKYVTEDNSQVQLFKESRQFYKQGLCKYKNNDLHLSLFSDVLLMARPDRNRRLKIKLIASTFTVTPLSFKKSSCSLLLVFLTGKPNMEVTFKNSSERWDWEALLHSVTIKSKITFVKTNASRLAEENLSKSKTSESKLFSSSIFSQKMINSNEKPVNQ
ncbi:uncharacterized protein LOC135146637 [Zophobas morio]|uniref:uncharacterized protein LOC135146637 n=1 Tax=Zophobas morio TaxID=2755281 RepID=UPI003082D0E1